MTVVVNGEVDEAELAAEAAAEGETTVDQTGAEDEA